ncbi:hypothetical protein [Corynebacterium mastitidis]|uniref:hypothetical protein n=1 Tax=Corynebacterium mastitidis TaxID=161890 RepID=UPI0025517787|nr:hypothetical protein [Corynebacterium mastitidis]MDK8450868.1 hypothetical protein [Corynebacterium mastitidis]
MRYTYWTIQAHPDPTLLLSFGVGVILVEESTGDCVVHTVERVSDLPVRTDLGHQIIEALARVRSLFRRSAERRGGIELSPQDSPTSLANTLVERWNNYLTVDRPRYVSARDIDSAAQLVFGLYIPPSGTGHRAASGRDLRQRVLDSYRAIPTLDKALHRSPEFFSATRSGRFDLAVVTPDKNPVELSSVFSFTGSDPHGLRTRIEAWNYRVDGLRSEGGFLHTPGGTIPVTEDTPIAVIYRAPREERFAEVFRQTQRQWGLINVRPVPHHEVDLHAASVESALLGA